MKIVSILGARPQFIKSSAVTRAIKEFNQDNSSEKIDHLIIHTGQHFDKNMSQIFFDEMRIPRPDFNLDINCFAHGVMTGKMLEKIEVILHKEKPDWILVYGDTNSTLAGALAASKLNLKIAHIESGLRSFNMHMPEEINRILTDRISNILFCPTEKAVENLKNEGYPNRLTFNNYQQIVNVGDVMYDSALFYLNSAQKPLKLNVSGNFILSTVHRQENTNDYLRLENILKSLNSISEEIPVVLPLHPRTKKIIKNSGIKVDNLQILEPVSYLEMVWLLKNSSIVITDSGGLQKEAYFFKKPCITLRDETEWSELLDMGINFLTGASKEMILSTFRYVINKEFTFNLCPYGNGTASKKIVQHIMEQT